MAGWSKTNAYWVAVDPNIDRGEPSGQLRVRVQRNGERMRWQFKPDEYPSYLAMVEAARRTRDHALLQPPRIGRRRNPLGVPGYYLCTRIVKGREYTHLRPTKGAGRHFDASTPEKLQSALDKLRGTSPA